MTFFVGGKRVETGAIRMSWLSSDITGHSLPECMK